MKEPKENIIMVCPDCADKIKKVTQVNFEEKLRDAIQSSESAKTPVFVKIPFADTNGTEHMWVEIKDVDFDSKEIKGILTNDPFFVKNIKNGMPTVFPFDIVENIYCKTLLQ